MSYNGMQNDIGDQIKQLEAVEARRKVQGIVLCRVDGKGFHNYTTKMKMRRPFDERLEVLRRHVVASIMKQTGARMGYAQSDEMSFVWHGDIYCAGRVAKMVSHLASMATACAGTLIDKRTGQRPFVRGLVQCSSSSMAKSPRDKCTRRPSGWTSVPEDCARTPPSLVRRR